MPLNIAILPLYMIEFPGEDLQFIRRTFGNGSDLRLNIVGAVGSIIDLLDHPGRFFRFVQVYLKGIFGSVDTFA